MTAVTVRGATWEGIAMARVGAGDESALAELYDQFGAFVYGLAHRVTGDQAAAEDVVQDVFVTLWERPGAWDPSKGSVRTWLGVLAHRRAVDRVRREVAARRREERDAERAPVAPPDIAEAATSMVVAQRVRDAVDALPPDQRTAIRLAYFGGHTFVEVARVLGIPEGTAKSRLRIGMRRLADVLRSEGIISWT
ncbi:MAG TPA: sigma-70 family RNA polymerase sigma factor [Acidimicrobiales bacterium]